MATIKEVARDAGVSTATVSRVVNGTATVTPRSRDRVLAAVRRLDYRPNSAARTLRSDDVTTLGLVIGDILNPFFTELARGVEDEARAHGYYVIIGNASEDPGRQDEYLDILLERRVAGLLLCPTAQPSRQVDQVARQNLPLVCVDRDLGSLDVPVVRSDNEAATRALAGHLVGLGHRRIAIISGPTSVVTGRERTAVFRAALAGHGVELPENYVRVGDFRMDSGVRAMGSLMSQRTPPSVVFAADNLMALGAMTWIRAHGLRIPADVGVASFDDLPWFALVDPPITAIRQQAEQLGRAGVRELIALMSGEPAHSRSLPCELIPRGSCGEGRAMT